MTKEMLIAGCNGQLGKALVERYPDAVATDRSTLDISDRKAVDEFDWSECGVIVNAAAYVNADYAETQEGRRITWLANAIGPANLARVALRYGIPIVHFSSEYVFDGTIQNHDEEEVLAPLSVYGEAKAAADLAVGLVPEHYILRTSWVVGDGHNFVRTMHRLAEMRINPKVVNDQFGRLTFTSELVRAVDHLLTTRPASGVYNLSNSGPVKSWAEIAADTFSIAGHDPSRVTPISTDEYQQDKHPFAPRPVHSDLDLTKIQVTGFRSKSYMPLMREYVASLESA